MKPEIAATVIQENVYDWPVGTSLTTPEVEEKYPDIRRRICHGCRYDSEAPSNQKLPRFCALREKQSIE